MWKNNMFAKCKMFAIVTLNSISICIVYIYIKQTNEVAN